MKKIIIILMFLSCHALMAQKTPQAVERLNELGKKPNFTAADLKEARELMLLISNEGRANPNYRKEKGCKTALDLPSNLEPLRLSDANNNFAQVQANYMARIKDVTHGNTDFPGATDHEQNGARCVAFKLWGAEACAGPSGDKLGDEPGGWMKSETHYRPTWNLDGTEVGKPGYPNNGDKYNSVGFGMARNDGRWYVVGFWNYLESEPSPSSINANNNNNNPSVSNKEVSCGAGKFSLASDGQIYEQINGNLTAIGGGCKFLDCSQGKLACTSNDNSVWYYQGTPNKWSKEPPANSQNTNNTNPTVSNTGTSGEGALYRGAIFYGGHKVYSANKAYYLTIDTDGNLVIKSESGTLKWSSKNSGSDKAHRVIFQKEDGNFCVQNKDNRWLWGTQQFGDKVVLENDGRLLQYNKDQVIWDSSKNQ